MAVVATMTRGSVAALPGSLVSELSIPFCESDRRPSSLTWESLGKRHLGLCHEPQLHFRTNSEDGKEVLPEVLIEIGIRGLD